MLVVHLISLAVFCALSCAGSSIAQPMPNTEKPQLLPYPNVGVGPSDISEGDIRPAPMIDSDLYHFKVTVSFEGVEFYISDVAIGTGASRSYQFDPHVFAVQVFGSFDRRPLAEIYTYDPLTIRIYNESLQRPNLNFRRLELELPDIDALSADIRTVVSPSDVIEWNQALGNVYGPRFPLPVDPTGSPATYNGDMSVLNLSEILSVTELLTTGEASPRIPEERIMRIDRAVVTYFLPFNSRAEYIVASFEDGRTTSPRYNVRDIIVAFCRENAVKVCQR